MRATKLELTWPGKNNKPALEPRILLEDPEFSRVSATKTGFGGSFDNLLIHGDNLLALKALEGSHAGTVQCIYIDPPYNTGSAFTQYEDGLEHSIWLSLMRDRLELLKSLLKPTGVIFVSIDENECAYLKVLMDEIFNRKNFCGQLVWEKKKKPSFLDANLGSVTEYVLAYAKDRSQSPAFIYGETTAGKKYPFNNAGNGIRVLTFPAGSVQFRCVDQHFDPQDMSDGNIVTELLDPFQVKDGRNVQAFRLKGEWRYSQAKLDEILRNQETVLISKVPFRPNHIKSGGDPKKMKNLLSIAHYQMSTYEDATEESRQLFGDDSAFDYPKPEMLISTLIGAVTEEGDLVLDSFAGSGTTGAVAHKMKRRWIMVELGEHCRTHILLRMKKVIDGTDPGGITTTAAWNGGGGFRYFRLAPSLLEKDTWGNWVINKTFNPAMLAQALCKLHGFTYDPSRNHYWMQGRSSETDFLYVTTQTLTQAQLRALSDDVGEQRSLLVCCAAFKGDPDAFPNLTLKKIPHSVLAKCEWGKDDYSLNIKNLPSAAVLDSEPVPDAQTSATTPKRRGRPPKAAIPSEGTPTLGLDETGTEVEA